MTVSRRSLLAGTAGLLGAGLAACSADSPHATASSSSPATTSPRTPSLSPTTPAATLIGDGSTTAGGTQPGRRTIPQPRPGQAPPQLVVVSWDGAGVLPSDQLTRFRELSRATGAHMTLFLSGIYFVPKEKRSQYHPPAGHAPGSSAIPFLTEQSVHRTIQGIGEAWLEGHEIGTHFNGHWCGPKGVSSWSSADWRQEIREAKRFVTSWRTITGFTDLPALPFDYDTELIGSRTPCLEGRDAMLPVAKELGWRYDTSATSSQVWPRRLPNGMWDLSMPSVPFRGRQALAMDYNFMYQQSDANPRGDRSQYTRWQAEVTDALKRGLERAWSTNRAPLVIGNHFEQWNGGIYMNAVADFMTHAAAQPDVHLVSFRELVDHLDAMDPAVLARLQRLGVGHKPQGGWAEYLRA